jgi:hypothetical protein
MDNVKITKVLGNDNYEVHIEPIETNNHPIVFGVCHDYALFSASSSLFCESGVMIPSKTGGSCNILPISHSIQIPIRVMGELTLPYLNESKYLKEDHYKNYGMWNESPVRCWADSDTVHIYDKGQKKFIQISRELYKQLNP